MEVPRNPKYNHKIIFIDNILFDLTQQTLGHHQQFPNLKKYISKYIKMDVPRNPKKKRRRISESQSANNR